MTNPPLIFNIHKPKEITSFDVIRYFKKNLPVPFGKIGHLGTLDPFATGVLLIGINGATKLTDLVHDFCPKTYKAKGFLGQGTPTGDNTASKDDFIIDLNKTRLSELSKRSTSELGPELKRKFTGEYNQVPPIYSASKYKGKPLHYWARAENIEIKKPPVKRFIHDFQIVNYEFPILTFQVTVSKGTYIRTLFEDMAKHLGTLGHLVELERKSIGNIELNDAITKNFWPKERDWNLNAYALKLEDILPFQKIFLNQDVATKYRNGIPINLQKNKNLMIQKTSNVNHYWIYDECSLMIGLGTLTENLITTKFNLPNSLSK